MSAMYPRKHYSLKDATHGHLPSHLNSEVVVFSSLGYGRSELQTRVSIELQIWRMTAQIS